MFFGFGELVREIVECESMGEERSSCAPRCSNLKGFAGTRNPTQGAGRTAADPGEGLARAEPLEQYVKKAKIFHREHVEVGATVDEGLGDSYAADVGRAEHWEHA